MPITFHFRPDANLVVCVHEGTRPDDQFLACCKTMYKHELYDLSMNRLVDMREAESASRSTDCLRKLASFLCEQFKETQAHPKIAIVAPKDLSFGIARMYEIFTEDEDRPWDLVIFRAVDAALAWLDLPDDFLDDIEKDAQSGSRGSLTPGPHTT